jgi:hypothetical protein
MPLNVGSGQLNVSQGSACFFERLGVLDGHGAWIASVHRMDMFNAVVRAMVAIGYEQQSDDLVRPE